MSDPGAGARDIQGITKAVTVLLYISIALAAIGIVSSLLEYSLFEDMKNNAFASQDQMMAAAEGNDQRQLVIGLGQLLVLVACIVTICVWIHRAKSAAIALGAQGTQYSPGWSVGWFFIPVMNIWKPYQAMVELWKASADPALWRGQQRSGLLPLWWALWLISAVLGQITMRLALDADTVNDYQAADIADVLANLLAIGLDVVFLVIVGRIAVMQAAAARRPPAGAARAQA